MKRIPILFLVVVLFAAAALPAGADTAVVSTFSAAPEIDSSAQCVLIVDRDSGQALYEKNTWDRVYPASTTKMMTALCAAEAVEDLDGTKVTVRQDVLDQLPDDDNSLAGLKAGEELTMRQLLYALLLPSGNDAALVIADQVSGSESGFAALMNQRAAELGCTDTFFVNPHGLAWREQYSTAWDLARIAEAFLQVPVLAEIAGTKEFSLATNMRDEPMTMKNSNLLMDPDSELYLPGVNGIKTGSTSLGASFVSAGERDGLRLICVAAEVPAVDAYDNLISPNPALAEARKYMEWAFSRFQRVTLCESGTEFTVAIPGAEKPVQAHPDQTVTAVLPRDLAGQLTSQTFPADGVSLPLKGGTLAGYAFWYSGETQVAGPVELYTPGGLGGFPLWVWAVLWALLVLSALAAVLARRLRRRRRAPAVRFTREEPEEDVWADRPEWMKEILLDDDREKR